MVMRWWRGEVVGWWKGGVMERWGGGGYDYEKTDISKTSW